MKRNILVLIAAMVIVGIESVILRAVDDVDRAAAPSEDVIKSLTETLQKHCPDAKFEVKNNEFIAKHGTMQFTVHGHSMTGEISRDTHQVEGPNFKGFLLRVSLQDGAYNGQADVPQTLKEPYFQTYIDAPATPDKKHYHWVSFSYGGRLDPKLKQAIFEAIPRTKRSLPDPSK